MYTNNVYQYRLAVTKRIYGLVNLYIRRVIPRQGCK